LCLPNMSLNMATSAIEISHEYEFPKGDEHE
jgi:hypothetical protein